MPAQAQKGVLSLGLAWRGLPAVTPLMMPVPPALMVVAPNTGEITLGVIGPWSLAEQSQNVVHDLRGIDRFRGWDHQLHNEPAFQLAMDRKYKAYRGAGAIIPGFSADAIRSVGLRLGNIETSATAGIEGRIDAAALRDHGAGADEGDAGDHGFHQPERIDLHATVMVPVRAGPPRPCLCARMHNYQSSLKR